MAAKSAMPWTLGRVKSAGLTLRAHCRNDRCGRSYEANLNVVSVTRQMLGSTLDIIKG